VKGTLAKEATPANSVRHAKPLTRVKHLGLGIGVKSTVIITITLPDKSVRRLTAPDPARTERDAKTGKQGPVTKSIPIVLTPKVKPVTKPIAATRGIPATKSEHGIQAAPTLASRMKIGHPSSQGLFFVGSSEDTGRLQQVFS